MVSYKGYEHAVNPFHNWKMIHSYVGKRRITKWFGMRNFEIKFKVTFNMTLKSQLRYWFPYVKLLNCLTHLYILESSIYIHFEWLFFLRKKKFCEEFHLLVDIFGIIFVFWVCLIIYHSTSLFVDLSNFNKIDFVMVAGISLNLWYYFMCPTAVSEVF